jgi:hypothetical protein
MTAVANTAFTAAQFNTYVRDNLLETAPAKASAAGQYFVATAANQIATRTVQNATVGTSQSTTSTSYTDLGTVGPTVTVVTGTRAFVSIATTLSNNTTNSACSASYAVTGATTIAASDVWRVVSDGLASSNVVRYGMSGFRTDLNAGTNTFTMKYLAGSNTATFANREIVVIPF